MRIRGKVLSEIENSIKEVLRLYQQKTIEAGDDGSIESVLRPKQAKEIDDWLRDKAAEIRTAALNLWQKQPKLSEPPKPEADPVSKLQNIRQWLIKNEISTTSGGKPGDEIKTTPETDTKLIYQADASQLYNIPKSTLSKAAKKSPGEVGYLWSGHKGKRVFYRRKDIEKLSRSRAKLGQTNH